MFGCLLKKIRELDINWTDEALILNKKIFGEQKYILTVLTPQYGKRSALVRPAKNQSAHYQVGNHVHVRWQGRLSDQLGVFALEPITISAGHLLGHKKKLTAVLALCHTLSLTLADHQSSPFLYEATKNVLFHILRTEDWLEPYAAFYLILLGDLGFGLELDTCAVTGSSEDLLYVSPKTGRAVSTHAALGYEKKLLLHPNHPDIDPHFAKIKIAEFFLKKHCSDQVELSTLYT